MILWVFKNSHKDSILFFDYLSIMTNQENKPNISNLGVVIGSDAENIVYHYCACDRDTFFTQFGRVDKPVFYDRITTKQSVLSFELLQQL